MMHDMIKLRPLELAHASDLARLANNKNVWDNLRDYMPHPYSLSDATYFIELTKKEQPQQNFGIFYEESLCGVIGLMIQKDVYQKSAEIGYWIGEPYWGKGIASEAVAWITSYGFEDLNLIRIFTGVFDYNKASMKVLEKNGFKKEAIFKKAVYKNGCVFDEHRYYKLGP